MVQMPKWYSQTWGPGRLWGLGQGCSDTWAPCLYSSLGLTSGCWHPVYWPGDLSGQWGPFCLHGSWDFPPNSRELCPLGAAFTTAQLKLVDKPLHSRPSGSSASPRAPEGRWAAATVANRIRGDVLCVSFIPSPVPFHVSTPVMG